MLKSGVNMLINKLLIGLNWILILICAVESYIIYKYRKSLMKRKERRKVLYDVSEKIICLRHEQEVYDLILNTAIKLIPKASKGSLLKITEDGNEFKFISLNGYSEDLKNIVLRKEEIYLHQINNFKDIAIIKNPKKFNEVYMEPSKKHMFISTESLNIHNTLSAPIYLDGVLTAILNLDSTVIEDAFSSEDIRTVKYILNEFRLAVRSHFIQGKLREKATYDSLTCLYSRSYLEYIIEYYLKEFYNKNYVSCIIFIDINNFKYVNDNYGYTIGDEILIKFSQILKTHINSSNLYGRLGGDEFLVLLDNCKEDEAVEIMEKLREICRTQIEQEYILDFSYGVFEITGGEEYDFKSIISNADNKMYKHKKIHRKIIKSTL